MDLFDLLVGPGLVLLGIVVCYFVVFRPLLRLRKEKPAKKNGLADLLANLPEDFADLDLPKLKLTDQERIRRLAESNPEKAKELVQLWLHQEAGRKKRR